jgi:hypothetical protein
MQVFPICQLFHRIIVGGNQTYLPVSPIFLQIPSGKIFQGWGNEPPPTRTAFVIVSNEGVFYKFIMQIKINRAWSSIEVQDLTNM